MIVDSSEVYEFVSNEKSNSFRVNKIRKENTIKINTDDNDDEDDDDDNNNCNYNNNNNYNLKKRKNLWNELKIFKKNCTRRFEFLVAVIKDVGYLLLTTLISLCMITIGFTYITDCPVCIFIPIYLVLTGILGITNQFVNYRINRRQTTDLLDDNHKDTIILKLTFIFLWFTIGCGSYWIFKIFKPNFNSNNQHNYCNQIVYLFAFWITILIYFFLIFLPLIIYIISSFIKLCCKPIIKKNSTTTISQPSEVSTTASTTIMQPPPQSSSSSSTIQITTNNVLPTITNQTTTSRSGGSTPTINKTNICLI